MNYYGAKELTASFRTVRQNTIQAAEDIPEMGLDSGLRSGTDIARALALGADYTLLGRAFMFAVAALGRAGAPHAIEILRIELTSALNQMGCTALDGLKDRVQ